MRFKLRTLLLVVAMVAMVCWLLRPPSVEFGAPEFSTRRHADGRRLQDVTFPVENAGILPVWVRDHGIYGTLTLGTVATDGELEIPSEAYVYNWKRLAPGEVIQVKRVALLPSEQVGLQLTDWLGRTHVAFHPRLELPEVQGDD